MNLRKIFFSFIFCFYSLFSFAQTNLVPNPSFDSVVNCFPTVNFLNCLPWYKPTLGSPDNFHTCFNSPLSVPNNVFGSQNPRTGFGYAGIIVYGSGDGREYISVRLKDSLIANKWYCAEFYISLGEVSGLGINNIGMYFSNDSFYVGTSSNLNYTPQIISDSTICNSDFINWIRVAGTFLSLGGEKYITIGNFFDNFNTDSCFIQSWPPLTYYYIDDVSVISCDTILTSSSIDTLSIPNIFTPNYDGVNDLFEITGLTKGDKVQIYNRWGTLVFETESAKMFWDGYTTSGEPCNSGVYFYIITLQSGESRKGYLTLMK